MKKVTTLIMLFVFATRFGCGAIAGTILQATPFSPAEAAEVTQANDVDLAATQGGGAGDAAMAILLITLLIVAVAVAVADSEDDDEECYVDRYGNLYCY